MMYFSEENGKLIVREAGEVIQIEAWGTEHGVTYEYDKSKLRINEVGVVYPLQGGTHEITVKCAGFSYVAKVTVIAPENPFSYENIDFTDAQSSRVIGSLNNASYKMTEEGLLCTASTGQDPLLYLNYIEGAIDTSKYKSITLTYKLESGISQTRGQMFFMTGANPNPAEAMYIVKSEVAASRSEVMPCGIVKLLLRSSEVKCSASYRAKRTSRGVASLHLRSILHVPRKRNT